MNYIAFCLNNLKEGLFYIQYVKILQFNSVPNFTCPIQTSIIIRNRNLKQTLYCGKLVAYHSVNMAPWQMFYFYSLSTITQNSSTCRWVSLTSVGSRIFTSKRKCQWMYEQHSRPRELSELRYGVREWSHVYRLKTLICGTFPLSA